MTAFIQKCPFCSEKIQSTSIKCNYCNKAIDKDSSYNSSSSIFKTVVNSLSTRYDIVEEIGRGGMATVYKAVQKNLKRHVALKVIHQNLLHDREFLQRFHHEAQLCASLSHPNIVTIYDEGEISGVHFMSMELLEGTDLQSIIRNKGKLSESQTLTYMLQLTEALHYAHLKGVIHRDIKSANIFICGSGRLVLTDFGIAHAASGTELTKAGTVIGTPEYMSPEQADGKAVDIRSDLYSVGVIIYECMTGKVPFHSDSAVTTIYKLIHEEADLSLLNNSSKQLRQLLYCLLSKNPDDRFEDAYETGVNINRVLEKKPILITKNNNKGRKEASRIDKKIGNSNQKLPLIVWLLSSLAIVLLAVLLYILYFPSLSLSKKEITEQFSENISQPIFAGLSESKDSLAWEEAVSENRESSYRQYLMLFPQGIHSHLAHKKIAELSSGESSVGQDQQIQERAQAAQIERERQDKQRRESEQALLEEKERKETERKAREEAERKALESVSKDASFTDSRDGKTYKTVRLGNQTWMAENLNHTTRNGSWCYGNSTSNCNRYGRLYDWNTARNVCPVGWRLPSKSDFENLIRTAGGTPGNSYNTLTQQGLNVFSILLAGWRGEGGNFSDLFQTTDLWASSAYGTDNAWSLNFNSQNRQTNLYHSGKSMGFSVRCIKN